MATRNIYPVLLLFILPLFLSAQNCSVNAGLDGKWCTGQKIILDGAVAGTIASGQSPVWSLISGPGQVTFEDANRPKTTAIASVAGEYIFRLSVQCGSGMASQDVKHIVAGGAQPDAGDDITVACLDEGFSLPLTGSPPPPGFTAYWTASSGSVTNNIYAPSFNDFIYCLPGPHAITLQYNLKDNNGCIFSDTKTVSFLEFVPPLELGTAGGCGQQFHLFATCTGAGQGQWSFVSPADGGGASFSSPNERVTGIMNPDLNQEYVVQFTITGSCHDQIKTIKFTIPQNITDASQADFEDLNSTFEQVSLSTDDKTITYNTQICGVPDTLIIKAAKENLKEGESIIWSSLSIAKCNPYYGTTENNGSVYLSDESTAVLTNLGYGNYSISFKVVNSAGCESYANLNIVINQPYENSIYFLTNECGRIDLNKFNFNNQSTDIELYSDGYINIPLPYYKLPKYGPIRPQLQSGPRKPIQAPQGGENIEGKYQIIPNLTTHKYEQYISIPASAPSGQYIFQVPYDYSCGNYATLVVDFSQQQEKVNGGTDQYFCGNTGQLIGNDRSNPEWILLSKKPADIPDPILEDAKSRLLTISNLTAQSEYLFGYVSRGGSHCPDVIDTVRVGVSDVPPPKPDAGADRTVCAFSAVTLQAQPAEIPFGSFGYWEVVSQTPSGMPPSFKPQDKPVTQVFNLQPNTTYVLRFTLENKCGKVSDEVTISTNETQGPPPAYAGADRCLDPGTSQVELSAIKVTGDFVGQWTEVANNPSGITIADPNNPKSEVSGFSSGMYGFIWSISGASCSSTADTVWITVGTNAQVERDEILLCNQVLPTVVILKATPAQGGYWTMLSLKPGNITDRNNATTTVTGLEEGIYIFRWTVSQGTCSGYADIKVIVGGPTLVVDAGPDIVLCLNSEGTVTLSAALPADYTGYWTMVNVDNNTPSAGFAFVSGNELDPHAVIKVKPGVTRLRWTMLINGICSDNPPYDDVVITYYSESIEECCPSVCTKPFDEKLCNNTPNLVYLNELVCANTGPGRWVLTDGPGGTDTIQLTDTFDPLHRMPGIYTTTYMLTDTLAGCPTSSDVKITVVPQPEDPTEIFAEICPSEMYLLPSGIAINQAGVYKDTLQTGFGCDSIIVTTLSIMTDEAYHQTLQINSNPASPVSVGVKVELTIVNPIPGAQYEWYRNGVSLGISNEKIEVEYLNAKDSVYARMVAPADEICSADGAIKLEWIFPSFKLPNAFTPNGDGENDQFRAVIDEGVEIVEMTIVSRWGQTMYSASGNQGWDGKFNGKNAPSDTYLYLIKYRLDPKSEVVELKGALTLIR